MINHKHKFIFIHMPKCGGSSIETSFGYNLWDKKKFPNNFCDKQLLLGRDEHTGKYLQHLTISEVYKIHPQLKNDYFSFAFVRNPWDRAISDYFYFGGPKKQSLKKFLLSPTHLDPSHSVPQYDFLKDNEGNMAVDFVGRFENFENDFIYVCNHLNMAGLKLPHINKRNKKHYTEYYDDEAREIVEEKYARDIEYFGYKFGE